MKKLKFSLFCFVLRNYAVTLGFPHSGFQRCAG